MSSKINIAIDGPAGSGKSTLAKLLARHYAYQLVDTGAMYRAIGYLAAQNGIAFDDEKALIALSEKSDFLFVMDAQLNNRVIVNGEDISARIRSNEMSMAASIVSQHEGVRAALVQKQQHIARASGVVMEGRDIGTVVLPNAEVKLYLTAGTDTRAARRQKELNRSGQSHNFATMVDEIKKRDHQDTTRAHSPLRQAADAIVIDTSTLDIDGVFATARTHVDQVIEKS